MHDQFDPREYVQPNSPEAEKFKDGAKLVYCKTCGEPLMVPADSDTDDCGHGFLPFALN